MRIARRFPLLTAALLTVAALVQASVQPAGRIRVLLDSDANNEMDDQYAIAYMLFNGDVLDIEGITVNRTREGGGIEKHAEEAERIVTLTGLRGRVSVFRGASGTFNDIKDRVNEPRFDGSAAVNVTIRRAHAQDPRRLVLLPVGKLTNIALALKKDPSIAPKVRIVWLGSNYPEPGEYNQENDEPALAYILDTDVEFEMVLVRYGKSSGTAAVLATRDEVRNRLPGKGPRVPEPVTGRHGGAFHTFGDYAVELFEKMPGRPAARALYDMAAVAIVKNPRWATSVRIPAPALVNGRWVERPGNRRHIVIWEKFDRDAIMKDFFESMDAPVPVGQPVPAGQPQSGASVP
jgi:inosine-uridine nucleoside N-ribohydrolase